MIVDDVPRNFLESLCKNFLVRGDDFISLPKHLEASEHRHDELREDIFEVSNTKFHDTLLLELKKRRQSGSKF